VNERVGRTTSETDGSLERQAPSNPTAIKQQIATICKNVKEFRIPKSQIKTPYFRSSTIEPENKALEKVTVSAVDVIREHPKKAMYFA
jgi:hypothetical protein